MQHKPNRRDMLKRLGLGGAAAAAAAAIPGAILPGSARAATPAADAPASPAPPSRFLRIAHLTDLHIQPERDAAEGVAQCLRHVQSHAHKVDLILVTGDCIMDAFAQDHARTQLQWDLWQRVWKQENSLPVRIALGNHDIWGWNKPASKTSGSEPGWGKQWACDVVGLEKPYHSFNHGGWHFVALDSVFPFNETSYTAKLDDGQFDWLERDLAAVDPQTPVLIMSHIPIISVTPMFSKPVDEPDVGTLLRHGSMHQDWRRLRTLFAKHPNVKLAISGHTHQLDRVDTNGVSYLCNGAVSGGWWRGRHLDECDAGYALLDLHPDGTFTRQYQTYNWTYRPDPAPAG